MAKDQRQNNSGFGRRLVVKTGSSQDSKRVTGTVSRKGRGPDRL